MSNEAANDGTDEAVDLAALERWVYLDCPLCGETIPEQDSPPFPDRDGGQVEFRFCGTCRTLFPAGANSAPDAGAETTRQADYHGDLWGDVNLERLDHLASTASQLAWEMAEHLPPPTESDAVIDIGAGRGNILHALARLGYPAQGCEPSSFLCQVARAAYLLGPDVLANADADTYLARVAATSTPVSGFVIWHVLEHLRHPVPLLRQCRKLAPTAMLFIELPVAQAEDIFPEHLFFPTPASLVRLAEELDLTIEHLSVTGDHRLRVFYRGRDPQVVDLAEGTADRGTGPGFDLAEAEARYRRMSPVFAHFVPGPTVGLDPVEKAEIGSGGGGS